MRVFVFEYVSGGGFAGRPMVASLVAEGDMMLAAVVRDFMAVPEVELAICRDQRLDLPPVSAQVIWVDGDWRGAWRAGLEWADAVLPIAPETDGILESLCAEVEESGNILLNSSAGAVRVAGSKLETYRRLAAAGVPTVASWPAHGAPGVDTNIFVAKPDQGVGCQGIRLLPDQPALEDFLTQCPADDSWLLQPYVGGTPASLSAMVGDDCVCLLGSNLQRMAQVDDGFVLLGCVVNGLDGVTTGLPELARQVAQAIDGLWGYVGIDLIITDQGPVVLEVNPRLTTSYVGLSRSVGCNVGGMLLELAQGSAELPTQPLRGGSVHVDLEFGRVA